MKISRLVALTFLALAFNSHAQYVSAAFREACETQLAPNALTFSSRAETSPLPKLVASFEDSTPDGQSNWRLHLLNDPTTNAYCAKVSGHLVLVLNSQEMPSSRSAEAERLPQTVATAIQATAQREYAAQIWYGSLPVIRKAVARELGSRWPAHADRLYAVLEGTRAFAVASN